MTWKIVDDLGDGASLESGGSNEKIMDDLLIGKSFEK